MRHFCSRYKRIHQYKEAVLQHLVFDDAHKVIYCYVPKVGCTTMKTAFLMLQGAFTLEELEKAPNVTHKEYLSKVKTLALESDKDQIKHKLNTYYKFMIVRNPLERLYSAFHEKLSMPTNSDVYNSMQKFILQYSNDNHSKFPNFTEFVSAFVNTNQLNDRHFLPMVEICDPCMMKYNYYASFRDMNHEVRHIFHLLNIPQEYYFNNIQHSSVLMPRPSHYTSTEIDRIYDQFDQDTRTQFFKRYSLEMDFFKLVST